MNIFYGCDKDTSLEDNEAFFVLECETNEASSGDFPHTIKNFFFLTSTREIEEITEEALSKLEANYTDFFIIREECKPYRVVFSNSGEAEEGKSYDFESMIQMLLFFANNTRYGWVLKDLLLKRAEFGINAEEESKIKKILFDSIAIFGRMQGLPTSVNIPELEYSFEFLANAQ